MSSKSVLETLDKMALLGTYLGHLGLITVLSFTHEPKCSFYSAYLLFALYFVKVLIIFNYFRYA